VLEDDPTPINMRSQPTTSARILGVVPAGMSFDVLEGPTCDAVDDIAWYRVNYRGTRGWIAEGTEVYFVIPMADVTPIPDNVSNQQVIDALDALSTCNNVLVEDNFEVGSDNRWFFNRDASGFNIGIQDGAYQVNMLSLEPVDGAEPVSWGSLQEVRFGDGRVDAIIRSSQFTTLPPSRTGIWLRYQDGENFLAFMIASTGRYRIARFQEGYTDIVGWTATDAINIGDNAVNTISVDVENDTFRLFINGQFVDQVIDSTWPNGRLAFYGSTTDQPVTFALEHVRICND
jgi:hypothetical protein